MSGIGITRRDLTAGELRGAAGKSRDARAARRMPALVPVWEDEPWSRHRLVLSRKLWKFPCGVLRACEGSVFQAARSRGIGLIG